LSEGSDAAEARQFTGTIDRTWGIASFTRLISGRDADVLDEGVLVEPPPVVEIGRPKAFTLFRAGCTPAPACTKSSRRSIFRISERR
jgi:hypothetical protein